jgi:S-adenosylmethionine:tRNA ribosyltransferase-isomerase
MQLSDFDFTLPEALIAQHPAFERDASRLLHVDGISLADKTLKDLPQLLREGDLLVFNNTRVIPARLRGRRAEVEIEITLHQQCGDDWEVFARPAKRLKIGNIINFADDFSAEVLAKNEDGTVLLRFEPEGQLYQMLEKYGQMPLPPYIKRDVKEVEDDERYQTIYARKLGAVAAPTAGLHFTPELLEVLKTAGIDHCFITLHVGAGTFLPVKTENVAEHKMHREWYEIQPDAADKINAAKREGRRVVAVGTTSLRSLEAAAAEDGTVPPIQSDTRIFITPGYCFRCVDALFTNFHLPKSTLFMLVSAFAGFAEMHAAYAHAIAQQYRFFSYGDACLLEKKG